MPFIFQYFPLAGIDFFSFNVMIAVHFFPSDDKCYVAKMKENVLGK
jgi:hypothetical protein